LANIHKEARILALNLNLGYTKLFKMLSPQETWDLKEKAYLEVAHLDLRSALHIRLQNSIKTSKELFPTQKEHK
jgi:hypothetical protein